MKPVGEPDAGDRHVRFDERGGETGPSCTTTAPLLDSTGWVFGPILGMGATIGLPKTVLADAGFASGPAVADLQAQGVEPLVAIGRTQPHRPYDFRAPPPQKTQRRISEPWRLAMKVRLETEDTKTLYKKRKQTVEPVFGIIKSAMGFLRFHLRGIANVASEWTLIALA